MEILKKVKNGRKLRTADVVVTGSTNKGVAVTFTDDARNKLYSSRVIFGLEKNKLYFFESNDDSDGYKISKHKSRNLWYVAGGKFLADKLGKYCGSYNLEYDTNKKTYYITLTEKEK